jgi:hypothetical protein
VQFTIGRLMIVVAAVGGLSAWLRVPVAGASTAFVALVFIPVSFALLVPFLPVSLGRRLLVATWVASLWPLSILWSLHAAWAVAYGYHGHPPGPADNGLVIEFVSGSVTLFILLSPISSMTCLFLELVATDEQIAGGDRWDARSIPALLMPLVWFFVVVVVRWDPLKAGWWFMD